MNEVSRPKIYLKGGKGDKILELQRNWPKHPGKQVGSYAGGNIVIQTITIIVKKYELPSLS